MKHFVTTLIISIFSFGAIAQQPVAYKLYTKDGKDVDFNKMIRNLAKSDVVLFGELHNNPICHWLQLEVTKALFTAADSNMVLGAEMFEADNQLLIDEYFAGQIRQKDFEKEARLWPNYKTDYKPLLELANENDIPFIATNIPRRYAALVNRGGFEALDDLSKTAKNYLAPLPMPFDTNNPSVQNMMQMDFGHGKGGPGIMGMVKAQASKDATMAWFIYKNINKKAPFIHYQGDFHSQNYGGIYWYLKHYNKKISVATISTVEADSLAFDESYAGQADYILVVAGDMTKTY